MLAQILHIAQLSADIVGPIVQWIVGLSGAVFLANQLMSFYKEHIREQPTPSSTYATKEEVKNVHGRLSRERAEIDRKFLEMEEDAKERREQMNEKLDALDTSIDAMPERIIKLLRETRDYHNAPGATPRV